MKKNKLLNKRSKIKPLRAMGLVLSAIMLGTALVACSPITEPTDSSDSNSGSDPQTTTEPSAQAGGSVIVGVTQEPDFLDPYLAEAAGTKEIFYNVFEGLLKLESDGTYSANLASEFSMAEDGMSYHFTVREGVRFHNGDELTAEDVVFSIERGAGLIDDTAYIPQFAIIESVTAEGNEVTVNLSSSDPDLLGFFTNAIIPADYTEQATKPIGTGPFVFGEYVQQQRVVLEKNSDYWQEGVPYLDSVEFRILPSADAAFVDLEAGRIDIFPYLTADKSEQLEDQFNLYVAESNMVQVWALNNSVEPLNDPLVRKALNVAVDKDAVIDFIMDGYGEPIHSGMSPAMGEFFNANLSDENGAPVSAAQIDLAKDLLAQAGYPDGFDLTITVPSNYVIHVQTAEVIVQQLNAIGVTATLEPVDWGTWLERVYVGRGYETTIIALTFEYTPSDVLGRYHSENEANFINFNSEDYDRVWENLPSIMDHDERVAAYHELQQILYEESASVFLQDPATLTAVKKNLDGYTIYPQYVQDMAPIRFTD